MNGEVQVASLDPGKVASPRGSALLGSAQINGVNIVHVDDAEAWAVGKRGGVDVPSTDATYHNNSKYYSQQAQGAAEDAEAAKDAVEDMGVAATALTPGATPTVTKTVDATGAVTLTFGMVPGATGNGIQSLVKTGTSGLVDTYTVTFTDGTSATFTVTNGEKGDAGNGIQSVIKTGTSGLVDTYTITFTDGTSTTFAVTNGAKGDKGERGSDFKVEDVFATLAALRAAFPTGNDYAYQVTGENDEIFIWSETQTDWVSIGAIRGPRGETGNGIASVTLNSDYTLTITYTNGTSTTTTSIRGAKGDTGNGIASVTLNSDYTLTIAYTDGTSTTTGSIRGATGAAGKGIASVTLNNDYTLTIAYTDGTSTTTTSIRGAKGDTGEGVASGGTAGQMLVKLSGTDYDTGWADVPEASCELHRFTATIPATGWTQNSDGLYTVSVSVPGILASDQDGDVGLVQSGSESTDAPRRDAYALLVRISAAADAIAVYATDVPGVAIPVRLEVLR